MISHQTSVDIALIYNDIKTAEEFLQKIVAATEEFSHIDLRDRFNRKIKTAELAIPSSDHSKRIFQVPLELAIPIIEATIASHSAKLKILMTKATAELENPILSKIQESEGDA